MNESMSLTSLVTNTWRDVIDFGHDVKPRGLPCRQLTGYQTFLLDPQNRLVTIPGRRWSLAYAAGELAWYLAGEDALSFIQYYAPSYHKFSDDGERLHGAYGPRIFRGGAWAHVVEKLKNDPDTRQAVIPIFKVEDLEMTSRDTPCTLALQFIRGSSGLDLVVTMRSNDAWLGLPYDAFCFTTLQELMALELGVDVGVYVHQVGSMHLYEKDLKKIVSMKDQLITAPESLPSISEYGTAQAFIGEMLTREERFRTCGGDIAIASVSAFLAIKEPAFLDLMTCAWAWKKVMRSLTDLNVTKTLYALLERKLGNLMLCLDSVEQKGERA